MIERMDHVGLVVDDLAAATEFFVELGLELQGEGQQGSIPLMH
jgi:catechol 2,3-dioxygenase-like lactoylglutathione lyase family enzyme